MRGNKKLSVKLKGLFMVLCLAMGMSAGVVYAEGTGSSTDNRKLQNGSFEEGQTWTNSYLQPNQSAVPSWNTTAFEGKIELFRENTGTYIGGVTLKPSDGSYAAELNADEESTLYQNVKTSPSSIYEWGLDHGGRTSMDTMALVIGPKQSVDPSKPSKTGRDQLMQMVDWLIAQGKTSVKSTQGLGEKFTVYSKKFAASGAFVDNAGNNAFSLTPSTIYTEEWHIWIMADGKAGTGETVNPWGHYGSNEEGSAGSTNPSGSTGVDLSKYYLYTVPAGQTDTMFGFVSVGCQEGKGPTYGNFLDNINFHLYHPLSGSTTTHGSGVVGGSDGSSGGTGSSTGHEVTVDNNLITYVTDGEKLKIQAVVKKNDVNAGCEFVGLYYTVEDETGNPRTIFLQRSGCEIEDTGSLTDEQKRGKWIKSTNTYGDIIYTYYLEQITSATDIHFVFIKSPTITYDPNGGKAYVVERTYNTDEANNVYSYKPAPAQTGSETVFIAPYVSKAAEGQNDGWKFMGWLLTGDTVGDASGYTPVNKEQLGSLLLSAKHTVACDYAFNGVNGDTKAQYFKIYNENISLVKQINTAASGTVTGVQWNNDSATIAYANVHKGLTMVAQWRWRQAFVPQIKSGNIYTDSAVGGTVEITSVTNTTDDNYNSAYNANGGKSYHATTDETVTAKATANTGYVFEGWYDSNGNRISTNAEIGYIETKESVNTYYARFAQSVTQTYIRQVQNGDTWEDTTDDNVGTLTLYSYTDAPGVNISCTASAGSNYEFVGWYDSTGNPAPSVGEKLSYVISENATYYARFKSNEPGTGQIVTQNFICQIKRGNVWVDTTDTNIATLSLYFHRDKVGKPIESEVTVSNGYKFLGWYKSDGNPVSSTILDNGDKTIKYVTEGNATYYARVELVEYNISYELDGGSITENPTKYTVETNTFSLNNPTKTGYTFAGWTGSNGTTAQTNVTTVKGTTGDKSYTANWTANTYTNTLNYDANEGTGVPDAQTVIVTYPDTQSIFTLSSTVPIRTGYIFDGWYTEASGGTKVESSYTVGINNYTGNQSATLYAHWTADTNTAYKVQHWQQNLDGNADTHDSTNYTLIDTDNLTGTTGASVTPSVKSYSGFTAPSTQTEIIRGDGSLVVNYYYKRNSYTVILNEGTGIASVNGGGTYLYGASVTINATVSTGYTWEKWTGTYSTTDQEYTFTMPASNVTDTANATANSYTNTLNYDANGGTGAPEAQTASVTYPNTQSTFTISGTVPTKEGYTFAGWYTETSGGTKVESSYTVGNSNYAGNQSATLYAQWIQNATYQVQHIKLDKNGVVAFTEQEQLSGPIGTTVYATAKTYAGYSFDNTNAGNILSGEVLAGGSLTLKLYYKPNPVTLTYKANGGTGADVDVTGVVDEVVAVRDETGFAKQGYVFKGWNTEADGTGSEYHKNGNYTMRSDSNVLYAQWIPATNTPYKVEHYKLEGVGKTPALADTQSLSGTTNTTATANPMNYEGYSFDNTITGTQTSGGIVADGSLVLKLYYVKQSSYSVEHYKVSSDGTSATLAEQQSLSGPVGKSITAQELTTLTGYTYQSGFNLNGMQTVITGKIAEGGSLVLKLYYTPNGTSLTYKANYDSAGADVNVSGVVDQALVTKPEDTFTRSGYYFNGWNTKADGRGILYSPGDKYIMLANNSEGNPNVLYAQWVEATESTVQYKVSHVKLDVNGNVVAEEVSSHYGTIGATVQANKKNYDGYSFDEANVGNIPSGEVEENGSLILKLYYIPRTALLIYEPNGGTGDAYTYRGCIGDGFTVDGNSFTRQGYTFAGWNTKANGADGTDYVVGGGYTYNQNKITLYAQWIPRNDTPYKVEYYKMDGIGMSAVRVDADTLNLTGTTDTIVTANQNNYEGYIFDDTIADTLVSGNIRADGNLVLRLYYVKRAAYNIYHYKVSADGMSCTLAENQQLYGPIGKYVTAQELSTLTGYNCQNPYNEYGMQTMATGTIADGGSLVLKLYYTPKDTALTYHANNGSGGTHADPGKVDQTLTVRGEIFSRPGYVFKGWNTKADGTGTAYGSGAGYVLLADTSAGNPNVLYAQWQKQENANSASSDNKTTESKPTEVYLAKDPLATAHPAPTGDSNRIGLYAGLLFISFFGIGFRIYKKRS